MSKLDALTLFCSGWLVAIATYRYFGPETTGYLPLVALVTLVICGVVYGCRRNAPTHTYTHTVDTCRACKERSLGL